MIKRFLKKLLNRTSLRFFLLSILPIVLTSAVAYASGGGGEEDSTAMMKDFGWRVLAFGMLVGFLYWATAKNIKAFFSERRQNIKATIEEKIAEKEETAKKFREYSAKLDKATEEINSIIDKIDTKIFVAFP